MEIVHKLENYATRQSIESKFQQIETKLGQLELKSELQNYLIQSQLIINNEIENWKENKYGMLLQHNETLKDILNCKFDSTKNELYLEAENAVENKNTAILQLEPFTLYKEKNDKLCTYEYTGPRYAKINQITNKYCLTSTINSQLCLNERSNQFKKTYCKESINIKDLLQIKADTVNLIIYCPKNNITINGYNQTCPDYPFIIKRNNNITISNTYTYVGKRILIRETLDIVHNFKEQVKLQLLEYQLQESTNLPTTENRQNMDYFYALLILILIIITISLILSIPRIPTYKKDR